MRPPRHPRPTSRGSLPTRPALLLLLLAAAGPVAAPAAEEPGIKAALADGKTTIDLRYRYEDVADDAVGDRHARASTLRTALDFRSGAYKGFSFQIEAENVAVVGNRLYADGASGPAMDRPVVADPAGTEINQALLRYRWRTLQITAGRQEIRFGDERFVGSVGWRQNHQSFDALRLDSWLGGLRFTYAFLDRVHRVFGDSQELAGHLFNVDFALQNAGKFSLYGHLLDYRDPGAAPQSTATWGLEFAGRRRLPGNRALLYEVEHAEQSDHADNPHPIDAGYSTLMLGASLSRVTVKLAWEQLDGGADGGQLRTPLATLHGHNGWADKFLATPPLGLEDLRLELSGKLGPVEWQVRRHRFEAASRSLRYGDELDLQLLYTSKRGIVFGLKGALYDADRFAADTDKWMLWSAYAF